MVMKNESDVVISLLFSFSPFFTHFYEQLWFLSISAFFFPSSLCFLLYSYLFCLLLLLSFRLFSVSCMVSSLYYMPLEQFPSISLQCQSFFSFHYYLHFLVFCFFVSLGLCFFISLFPSFFTYFISFFSLLFLSFFSFVLTLMYFLTFFFLSSFPSFLPFCIPHYGPSCLTIISSSSSCRSVQFSTRVVFYLVTRESETKRKRKSARDYSTTIFNCIKRKSKLVRFVIFEMLDDMRKYAIIELTG